jgi:cytochrome c oxidase subunit 1
MSAVHDHEHEHHHKQNFISKYIFSLDHKMIAKQYLITGIIMGIIGVGMSLLFRMQLVGQRNLLGFCTTW